MHRKFKWIHFHPSQEPPATVEVLAVHLTGSTEHDIKHLHQELLTVFQEACKNGSVKPVLSMHIPRRRLPKKAQVIKTNNAQTMTFLNTNQKALENDCKTFGGQVQNTVGTILEALVEEANNALALTCKALGL